MTTSPLDPNRPSAQFIDDILYIRASAIGECPKSLALIATGESRDEFPPQVLRAFEQGHFFEEVILKDFKPDMPPFATRGDMKKIKRIDQASFNWAIIPNLVVIQGSLDTLFTFNGEPYELVDAKSCSPSTNHSFEQKYLPQVSTYAHGIWQEYNMKGKTKMKVGLQVGIVDREAGSIDSDFAYHRIPSSSLLTRTQLRDKVKEVLRLIDVIDNGGAEALADEPCIKGYFSCPVQRLHPIIAPVVAMELDDVPKEVTEALETLELLSHFRSSVLTASEEKACKAVVKTWALEQGLDSSQAISTGIWSMSLSEESTKQVVEITPEELIELVGAKKANPFIKDKTTSSRFTLKES